jgi:biotin carboxyl carrier protein
MTFAIEIGGRSRTVTVESIDARSQDGPYRVTVDGSAVVVDCRPTPLGLSMILDGRRSLDVALTERAGAEWLVQWRGLNLTAVVDGRRNRRGREAAVAGGGEQRVTAPMPGCVIRVLVKPGDEVAARQGLVVVEAMKMENELTSPKAGRVREVAVSEGTSIEAGRLLVVVD